MTLGALHVSTQEDSSHIARDQVRLGTSIKIKSSGGPKLGVGPVGTENLFTELVEWLVISNRLKKIRLPLLDGDILMRPTLHQHHIKRCRQVSSVVRTRDKLVDRLRSFVRRRIGQEAIEILKARRHPR